MYITPYALGGLTQAAELNVAQTAYDTRNDATNEVGIDLKYNVTSNLTLDLTANTDFAQVEADDQQINLTRFSLFFLKNASSFKNALRSSSSPPEGIAACSTAVASD